MAPTTAPTVQELALAWADQASPDEVRQASRTIAGFRTGHGFGMLTTDELRGLYRMHVQEGNRTGYGMHYALAQGCAEASAVLFASLSSWRTMQDRKHDQAAARKAKRAASAAARKARAATA